ncbi:MAG TPA: bifunctional homocysteine S-methyltransferase/methylenetetrahydrofolate reductase [Gemmatimonadales bacterium]|nr:bifunctional homocysteine S-methyltransferase/methylenetetrahydrofolate reductase [Gemmatimonadales bacterium]
MASTTSTALRDLIADSRVHVFDGAMGTMLYSKGNFSNVCYDELNLKRPELVREIHEAYVTAGAEILETNTYGANPLKLAAFALAEETEVVNRAAATLARDAARHRALVVGAIGPLGVRIEPYGPTGRDEARAYFARAASGLLAGGVDGFILETFSDLDEIKAALDAVRGVSDLPVIAQMTIAEDGRTAYGHDPETIATRLDAWGADVVGLNCSVGPAGILEAIERMARVTGRPISAQPNAGLPKDVGDRKVYVASPEHMATYARRLIEAGARFIGGCCGTTPDHIKHIRDAVASVQPRHVHAVVSRADVTPPAGISPVPLAERSNWGRKLAAGEMVTSVEIVPPKGWDPSTMVAECRALKAAGVDAVNVPDGPRAQSRLGVVPAAIVIERDVGIETVIHYCCRDRNLLGMLRDLLGAAAAGLRNVLIITGDPPKMGPYPNATAVFDIDSIGLTNLVYRLNHGLDPGGNPIGAPTRWVVGVGANPAAVDLERELKRFAWKADAGAEFVVTQPVFDVTQLERFVQRVARYRVPVVAGIWPLISLRNAEFLANEVPGVSVPQEVLDRMRRAQEKGKEAALAEGVAIAREVFARVKGVVQGVQVSAPLGRVEVAIEVVRG